ncbi:MAG: ATP-binding protein [Methylophilaceae bacterium]
MGLRNHYEQGPPLQYPFDLWHAFLGHSTIAYAILDHMIHVAHHIHIMGDYLRKGRKEE